jgi:flavodoxin
VYGRHQANMTKTEIYYFSGTGNSLFVARSLADKLDAKLCPIVPLLKQDFIETDEDVVGLVFPIYDFKAPPIIESFVTRLANLGSKYVFAVATFGFIPMKATKKLQKTVQSCNGKLSGAFTISMPNNGIITEKLTAKKQVKMQKTCAVKLEKIANYVAN